MPLPKDGLIPLSEGEELAWIELHEEDSRTVIYTPTYKEIVELCEQHGVDSERIMLMIRTRQPEIYAFVIHAPTFRDSYKEKE